EQAAKSGEEKDLVLEARFWLGETYWRLGRVEAADRLFRQVVETAPKGSTYALWATHSVGWTALRIGDATRARDTFAQLLARGGPHALLDSGWFRLGWWSLAGQRGKESVAAFRTYLAPPTSPAAAPRTGTERDWAEAGLALALLGSDVNAARAAARGLEARRSP